MATSLKPRKLPIQDRSMATIDALHTAAIQVLTRDGLAKCTTTRIAERAGISVGSIYQYYPNRDALLTAILQIHLNDIAQAVEHACHKANGTSLRQMAEALVRAFVGEKLRNSQASRALYAVADARGGAALAARMRQRIVAATATMLATAKDMSFEEPAVKASIAVGALVGPVQMYLKDSMSHRSGANLERELIILITAYFQAQQPTPRHREIA